MNLKSNAFRIHGLNLKPKNPFLVDSQSTLPTFYFSAGGTVIKEVFSNNEMGHVSLNLFDNYVSALCLSKDSRFLAAGAKGTANYKEDIAFVAVLDTRSFTVICSLSQYREEIKQLAFSDDSNFLAILSDKNLLSIHATSNFNHVRNFKNININDFTWLSNTVNGCQVLLSIEYLKVLRFEIHFDEFGKIEAKKDVFMLSDKTKRHYEFMCANERGNYLYTGTSIGEIHIFDIARGRIVNSFTVSNTPIIRIEDYGDYFVISNKEKQLKKVFLLGETFDVQNKDLTERIVYIANNKPEKLDNFLISDEGSILRYKPETHTYTFWRKLPTNQVAQVSISENKGIIAVACTNGDCEFWNLKYKTFINRYTTDKEIGCSQVHISDRHDLCVVGYTDGSIRAFGIKDLDLSTEIKCNYVIHKAHKTAIKSIELKENTLITGAADSMIRVWDFRMKNIINEVQYHCKEISLLKLSNLRTDTLFTASKDRQISAFSLRNQRKMSCSILPNGYVTALYQINDNYIITAGYNCDITLWNLHQMVAEKRITVLKPVVNIAMLNEDLIAWTDAEGFLTIHSLSKNKTVYELRVTYMKIIDFFTIANRDVLIICETGEFIEIELPF